MTLNSNWNGQRHLELLCMTWMTGCCSTSGLGIDDMFAIVTSCENLSEEEMLLPLNEKIGLVVLVKTYIPTLVLSR